MSEWGIKYAANVGQWIKRDRKGLCQAVESMTRHIIDQEREVKDLLGQLSRARQDTSDARMEVTMARCAEAHLKGYIERVKDLDPEQPNA